MKIENGCYVRFNYLFRNSEGEIVYESNVDEPTWYIHGQNLILGAFEEAMAGHEQGERLTIDLKPEDAFGERRDELISEVTFDMLPEGFEPKLGEILEATNDDGMVLPMQITEVKENSVILDGNHPLAGMTLVCDLMVEEVREATSEETAEMDRLMASPGSQEEESDEASPLIMEFGGDDEEGTEVDTPTCSTCSGCAPVVIKGDKDKGGSGGCGPDGCCGC